MSNVPPLDYATPEEAVAGSGPPELAPQEVKDRAVTSVKSLGARTAFTLGLRLLGSLALSRLLFADDYGAFAVGTWILGIGAMLADAGLAGALLRQERPPTVDEQFTVFVSQQILAAIMFVMVVTVGPRLAGVSHLSASEQKIVYLLAVNLFMNSLRVIPLMTLERELKFNVIARVEFTQGFVYTGLNVFLAWCGWGAWSLAMGNVISSVFLTVGLWIAAPWKPVGKFRLDILKRLSKFGAAFQLSAIMPGLFAGWVPILVGKIVGLTAVGYVNWAGNQASIPLALSAILNRVAFPAYARLQGDASKLGDFVRASIRKLSAVMVLIIPIGILACPAAIPILFAPRWIPAIPLVQWFGFDVLIGTLLGILIAAQNATGHSADRLWITIGAGIADWVFGWLVIHFFGLNSVGPTVVATTLIELWITCWLLQRHHPSLIGVMADVFLPLFRTGAWIIGAYLVGRWLAPSNVNVQCGLSLAIFLILAAAYDVFTGGRGSWLELRGIWTMFRRKAAPAATAS